MLSKAFDKMEAGMNAAIDYIGRDRVFYLRLFNKKHVKSHESIMWASSLDWATFQYEAMKDELPRHVYYEISDYALEDKSAMEQANSILEYRV